MKKLPNLKYQNKEKYTFDEILFFYNYFIKLSSTGQRTLRNGKRISANTINNYLNLYKHLNKFSIKTNYQFELYNIIGMNSHELEEINVKWIAFYKHLTQYFYNEGYFDNFVGNMIKCLKTFFSFVKNDLHIDIGDFYNSFYIPYEKIPFIVLTPSQLSYLIYSTAFEQTLSKTLVDVKDVFVMGCTMGLRISDLLALSNEHLVIMNNSHYIKIRTQKTGADINFKLPDFAIAIINKNNNSRNNKLLPNISKSWFNKKLKELASKFPDEQPLIKTRERNGISEIVYKNKQNKQYMLSDHFSSLTMRRTAITNMILLGVPEFLVRRISGHSPYSNEFYKYIGFSQSTIDTELNKVHKDLKKKIM